MLHSIDWWLDTDISGQPMGPAVQGEFLTACPLKVKVQCTVVQALRLCTGRMAHRGSRVIALIFLDLCTRSVRGKVNPCSGTEALYRPYGP